MYSFLMDYTPIILKNKGVPCSFSKVKYINENPPTWEKVYDAEGNIVAESLNIKFTNNSIADIETHYKGLDNWQNQLESLPVSSIRQTFSFVLNLPVNQVGEMMLEGELLHYSNVIGAAWAIANGVDPKVASRMLRQSAELAVNQRKTLNETLTETLNLGTEDSPGTNGSDSGSKPASRSKNSGK